MKFEIGHPESPGTGMALAEAATASSPVGDDRPRAHPRRKNSPSSDRPSRHSSELDAGGISKAILTIRNEYSRPLTVASLARECGMSVRSLHRLYRSVTGTTIGKDLVARRIEVAAEMLRDGVKLEPVAMETGLRSAKNLCRLFKEHRGLTPGQWKHSCQGPHAGPG